MTSGKQLKRENTLRKVQDEPGPSKGRAKKSRRKSSPEKLLKKKLWELCKQITRKKYGNTCYTCGKTALQGSQWQTGHFIPSSTCGLYLRYDLRNLRPQCYYCNINLGGNGSAFYRNLVHSDGQEYVDQLFRDKQRVTKSSVAFFEEMVISHTAILEFLG